MAELQASNTPIIEQITTPALRRGPSITPISTHTCHTATATAEAANKDRTPLKNIIVDRDSSLANIFLILIAMFTWTSMT